MGPAVAGGPVRTNGRGPADGSGNRRDDTPPQLHNWRPIRRSALPFASVVVLSSDDPFCSLDRGTGMAADWGSSVVVAGPRGHLNAESGLGDWPQGRSLLAGLAER